MPKLNNWCIIYGVADNWRDQPNAFTAPELLTPHLQGRISDDYRFWDGDLVTTSTIKGKRGDFIVTNSGTEYEIGNPSKEYEKEYPNSKERLLNSLEEV